MIAADTTTIKECARSTANQNSSQQQRPTVHSVKPGWKKAGPTPWGNQESRPTAGCSEAWPTNARNAEAKNHNSGGNRDDQYTGCWGEGHH